MKPYCSVNQREGQYRIYLNNVVSLNRSGNKVREIVVFASESEMDISAELLTHCLEILA
jgi:hypothetical protein